MKKNLISIVLATHNRVEQLKNCVESVYNQTYPSIEFVIVNDSSEDNTTSYLDSLSSQNYIDLKVIHNTTNHGLPRSLNIGLENASGEYIARIDDDDIWLDKNKLLKQINYLKNKNEVALVGTSYLSDGVVVNNPFSDNEIRKSILFRCPFRHSTVVFRHSIINEIGNYNESLKYSEDWDLWLRIGKNSKMANLKDITTIVNTENNVSSKYFLKQLSLNRTILSKYWSYYPRNFLAKLYHIIIAIFFKVVPLNSCFHKLAQNIFAQVFLNKS